MKQYTDQIAYRAKHLISKLAMRDESPSKAARFAAFRYISLMEKYIPYVEREFEDGELGVLIQVAQSIDTEIETNITLFWAHVYDAGYPSLADRLKAMHVLMTEAIIDLARIRKYDQNTN